MPFFDQLVDQTAAARAEMLRTPQLQAGLTGRIDRATYIAYLTQAYHHVSHTVPLMREARVRLAHAPMLVAALDEYIEEETGHEAWILDDIAAAGGNRQAAIAAVAEKLTPARSPSASSTRTASPEATSRPTVDPPATSTSCSSASPIVTRAVTASCPGLTSQNRPPSPSGTTVSVSPDRRGDDAAQLRSTPPASEATVDVLAATATATEDRTVAV